MAFNTQQKQDIIYYLGWPGKTLLLNSTHYNSVIASRLDNLIPEIESQANTLVARIKEIDQILRTGSVNRASTLELQDIKLSDREMPRLRSERRTIIGELSDLLDVDVNKSGGTSISVVS